MPEGKEVDKIWWDEKNQIIRYKMIEDVVIDEEIAQSYVKQMSDIIKAHKNANRLLIDLINAKNIPSSKTRSILAGLVKTYSDLRIAYLTKWTTLRVALNFIITASGHREIKAFNEDAEAIKWLQEKK